MFHILQRKFHSGEWIIQKPSKGKDTLVGIAKEHENNWNSLEIFPSLPNMQQDNWKETENELETFWIIMQKP